MSGAGVLACTSCENGLSFYLDNCFLVSFRQVLCLTFCLFPFSHDLQNKKTFPFKVIVPFSKHRFNELDWFSSVLDILNNYHIPVLFQSYLISH